MDNKVKLSIIIPIYNVISYLDRCLNSVINQTYQNIEIICVDDGSNDGSEKIIDEYKKIDSRIIVFHIAHSGVSNARNLGIAVASGEYIGFVDSDDYIESDMYEVMMTKVQKNNMDMVQCDYDKIYSGSKKNKRPCRSEPRIIESYQEILTAYFLHRIHHSVCTIIFKSIIAKRLKFDENISIGEDILWVYEFCKQASNVYISSYLGYHYCCRNRSAMNSKLSNLHFQPLYIIEKQIEDNKYDENLFKLCVCLKIRASITLLLSIVQEQKFLNKYEEIRRYIVEHSFFVYKSRLFPLKIKSAVLLVQIFPHFFNFLGKSYIIHRNKLYFGKNKGTSSEEYIAENEKGNI